jgi:RNA polymerase sigma-70 factor (ECF subfamily)
MVLKIVSAETNDRELIFRLKGGDLLALGLLYDHHRQMVYRTALAISGDSDAAADLLQDVFLRLYRFVERVDPELPLEPWLYRMTANLSYTWVKRQSRWLRPLEDITEWLAGSRKQTPHQMAELSDDTSQLQQAVLRLPLPQRVVVVLFYINDLSVQEISEILDVPIGTVKSRLHYGRQALKDALERRSQGLAVQYEFT